MSEHSKLPWNISEDDCIVNRDGVEIALVLPSPLPGVFQVKPNAEFILKACNSHAKLQAQATSQSALRAVCEKIKKASDDTATDCHEFLSRLDDLWGEIEAALTAAAEGKQE